MKRSGLAFLVIVLAILVGPLAVGAQPPKPTYRIGVLTPGSSPPGPLEAFREGLRDLGYVEGQTIVIEWRFAEGKNERLPDLADELVRLKVDVIFAVNTPAALAAKKATTTIPIVIARLADPTKTGLVPSLGRPGGNITGLSSIAEELATKRLELVKDTLPGVTRVVMVYNPDNPGHLQVVKDTVQANTQMGLQLETQGVRSASDLPEVFQAAVRTRAQALLVQDDVRVTLLKRLIIDQAARQSLPVFAQYREFAEAGALAADLGNAPGSPQSRGSPRIRQSTSARVGKSDGASSRAHRHESGTRRSDAAAGAKGKPVMRPVAMTMVDCPSVPGARWTRGGCAHPGEPQIDPASANSIRGGVIARPPWAARRGLC